MATLRHLAEEICVGLQIYVAGRSGTYLKTAFVLCDDYTELISKLALLERDPDWSDQRTAPGRGFKNYHDVMTDVASEFVGSPPAVVEMLSKLHLAMSARRVRRNVFFHSTTLLDLQVTRRDTAEALSDLIDYGELLFGEAWAGAVQEVADMEALILLVRLDHAASRDGTIMPRVYDLFARQPRNMPTGARKTGVHVVGSGEDLHALLCARWGGNQLIEELEKLLLL